VGPGRTVTPVEVPRPPVIDEQPPVRMASMRTPPVSAPPRPSIPQLAPVPPSAESTTVARQGRNTLDGMRAVRPTDPPVSEPPVGMPPRASLTSMPVAAVQRPPVPAPPPLLEEDPQPRDAMELTPATPLRAAAAAQRVTPGSPPSLAPVSASAPASVAARAAPNRLPLIAGLAVLVLVLAGVAGFFMSRPAPMGYILVKLPDDLKVPVRVSFGGQELDTSKPGPVLQQVKAGPAPVMVSAEGFHPFTQQVVIQEGLTPTQLEVKLERKVQLVRVVIVTQPPDAELKVDGKVVREKGSSSTYIDERPAGTAVLVEASAPGFKPARKQLTPEAGKPVDEQLKLEADGFEVEVASTPSGATIFAGGKEWGETPARVRFPNEVKQVILKLRCHDDDDVNVAPGSGQVKGRLKKQRGCK
jgi:hypothetical protein